METSLRLEGGSKNLRIHAKEKLLLGSDTLLQAHGEIDTSTGAPSYLAMFLRQFYPQLSVDIGVGIQLDKGDDFSYNLRGKKAFTRNGLVGINFKGRLVTDKEFKPRKIIGAVELAWAILDFRKDQDVRLKVGYELYQKMPYVQLKENNWTLNAYMDGKWDVKFDI